MPKEMRGVRRSVRVVWSAAARREAISARVVGSRSWVSHCWARASMGWVMAGVALPLSVLCTRGEKKERRETVRATVCGVNTV